MYGAKAVDVQVCKGVDLIWLVLLDGKIVGRFMICGDALAYATMLECTPRARKEAVAA